MPRLRARPRRRRRVGGAQVALARAPWAAARWRRPARGAGRAPLHVGLRPEAVSQPRVEAVRERAAREDDARRLRRIRGGPSGSAARRRRRSLAAARRRLQRTVRRDRPRVTPEWARRRRLLPTARPARAPAPRPEPDRPAPRAGPGRPLRRRRRGEDLRRAEHRPARPAGGRRGVAGPPRQPPPRTTTGGRRLVGAGRHQHARPADPCVHARLGPAADPRLRLHPRKRVRGQRRGHAPAARPAAEARLDHGRPGSEPGRTRGEAARKCPRRRPEPQLPRNVEADPTAGPLPPPRWRPGSRCSSSAGSGPT